MDAKPLATTRSATGIPTGRLSIWWLMASEIVIFGGVLASYVMHRIGHSEFGDYASHTNVWAGGFNTFVLLTSSLFAVLAHQAAENGDGKKAAKLLWATIGGGVSFSWSRAWNGPMRLHMGIPFKVMLFGTSTTLQLGCMHCTSSRV